MCDMDRDTREKTQREEEEYSHSYSYIIFFQYHINKIKNIRVHTFYLKYELAYDIQYLLSQARLEIHLIFLSF